MSAAEPVAIQVTRYRCPFCKRSRASKAGIRPHIPRCWHNPAARACGTCRHYLPAEQVARDEYGEPEGCDAGLSPMVPATEEDQRYADVEMVTVRNCPGWTPREGLVVLG